MTVFLILWLGAQAVSVFAVLGFCIGLGRIAALSREPVVAVIVAVKGRDIRFDPFADSLFDQDYAKYRVIFAVESELDAAIPAIETWRRRLGDRVALVIAGLADDEGQKVTNLRAAVSCLTPTDEVLVLEETEDAGGLNDRARYDGLGEIAVTADGDEFAELRGIVDRRWGLGKLEVASGELGCEGGTGFENKRVPVAEEIL